jgi:UPF0755 protein
MKLHKWLSASIIAAISIVIVGLAIFLSFINFLNSPAKANAPEVNFQVHAGDGLRVVTSDLSRDGIVPNNIYFILYLKLSGLSGTIQAGNYRLSPAMTPLTVADILTKGRVASKSITIPEGWTIDQIGSYLQNNNIVTKEEFIEATKKNYSYDFLKGKPADVGLEGFLFPDTYQVSVSVTADQIVKMMLDNFDKRVTTDMRAAAQGSGYSVYQVVTLASIVEREVSKPEDRKVVAGIFLNRLNQGMKLQSDVTLEYALGVTKKTFTDEETQYPSPYNTYYVDGLPKGPICNPGLESINAVLYPQQTDFLYFLSVDGTTYFAKTLAEHEQNVAQYLK